MPERINSGTIWFARPGLRNNLPVVALLVMVLAGLIAGCSAPRETTAPSPKLPADMTLRRTDITLTPVTSLNSPQDDFGLAMPLDTTLAFFTTNRSGSPGLHSIYWARRASATWGRPEPAVAINNSESNGVPSLAPNGETMYFAGCDYGFGDCDLYEVESGVRGSVPPETVPWMVPRNMGLSVNGSYWDSQPCVAADGSIMAFASDRPGGFGGRDIWLCLRNQDGSWSRPINAGAQVNTVYDEVTPFITPDRRTLFFASNGHPGMGGFDLFLAELDPETDIDPLLPALNLGQPINSTADDIALTVSSGGTQTFIASNRSGGLGGYDIYRLSTPPVPIEAVGIVHGVARDEAGEPIFARIDVSDLSNGNIIGRFQTNPETGEYAIVLRRGDNYAVTARAPGRLFASQHIEIPAVLPENTEYRLIHTLQPVNGSTRLLLFFAPNSVILERESTIDLDFAVSFLRENPDVRIEVGGHTDNVGDPEENRRLSLERAQAVKAYLIGNRIKGERIAVQGYGDTRPIASNSTEEGRQMNRRVEMKVVE